MGEVIAFRAREKRSRDESAPPVGEAQILFFLGVRYARLEEQMDARENVSPDQGQGVSQGVGQGHGPRGGRKRKSRARG